MQLLQQLLLISSFDQAFEDAVELKGIFILLPLRQAASLRHGLLRGSDWKLNLGMLVKHRWSQQWMDERPSEGQLIVLCSHILGLGEQKPTITTRLYSLGAIEPQSIATLGNWTIQGVFLF